MPRRRCVGCGRIAPKSELVRVAVDRDHDARRVAHAVIDARGVLPGRGAYLCRGSQPSNPDADCLQHALHRGGLARTLRRNVTLDLAADRDRDPEFVESTQSVAQPAASPCVGTLDPSLT